MFRSVAPIVIAAAALAAPVAAQAPASQVNVTSMTAYLRTQGLLVENVSTSTRQALRSEFQGAKFLVFFTGCNASGVNCGSIQFYAGFKPAKPSTVQVMNEWNKTKRYSRAYIDNEGDPCVEMDVAMAGGALPKVILDDVWENWRLTMSVFKRTIFTATS